MSKAVFLSYAREDAAAVKCIAETLRAAGIEVWFDANELRGGDAWDAVINKQILECTLFIPVISLNTEKRHEGYFRREWRMGVDRTKDMSDKMPFLVPVLIDDLDERTADVPTDFRRVHWTRMPGGKTDEQFTLHISAMLESKPRLSHPAGSTAQIFPLSAPPTKKLNLSRVVGLVAAIAIGLAVVFGVFKQRGSDTQDPSINPTAEKSGSTISAKSIAVMPFINKSTDEDSAYFAEGVHEDIVTQLTQLSEVEVASISAVKRFEQENADLTKIGEQLKVRYILQGSIRRAGNDIRVSVQLTDSRSGMNIWAEKFDRKLENIFALQSEISRQIAGKLKAQISPKEAANLDKIPTSSISAYDDYLKARASLTSLWVKLEVLTKAAELLQSATTADPEFVDAWALLSTIHSVQTLRVPAREESTPVKAAFAASALQTLRTAQKLNPHHVSTYRAEGYYQMLVGSDYVAAARSIDQAIMIVPNDTDNLVLLGIAYQRMGQLDKSTLTFERAYQLDKANPSSVGFLRGAYNDEGNYEALIQLYQEQLNLNPQRNDYALRLKYCQFLIDGKLESFKAYETALSALELTEQCDASAWKSGRMVVAMLNGQFEAYAEGWRERWEAHYRGHGNFVCPLQINAEADHAAMLIERGNTDEARIIVKRSLAGIKLPINPNAGCSFDVDMMQPKLAKLNGKPEQARVDFEMALTKLNAKADDFKKFMEKEILLQTASLVAPDRAYALYRDIQLDPIRMVDFQTVCANPWTYPGLVANADFQAEVRKDGRFVDFLTAYGFLPKV